MAGSALVIKERDKPNSRKEEMTVAKVKVVRSKHKEGSKESGSSEEWIVIS